MGLEHLDYLSVGTIFPSQEPEREATLCLFYESGKYLRYAQCPISQIKKWRSWDSHESGLQMSTRSPKGGQEGAGQSQKSNLRAGSPSQLCRLIPVERSPQQREPVGRNSVFILNNEFQ